MQLVTSGPALAAKGFCSGSPRREGILLRQPSPRSDFAADATGRAAARDSARRARREEAARRLLQRVRLGRSLPPPFCCCRRDASQPAASSIHRAPPLDPILSQHPARGHLPRRRCSRLCRSPPHFRSIADISPLLPWWCRRHAARRRQQPRPQGLGTEDVSHSRQAVADLAQGSEAGYTSSEPCRDASRGPPFIGRSG